MKQKVTWQDVKDSWKWDNIKNDYQLRLFLWNAGIFALAITTSMASLFYLFYQVYHK